VRRRDRAAHPNKNHIFTELVGPLQDLAPRLGVEVLQEGGGLHTAGVAERVEETAIVKESQVAIELGLRELADLLFPEPIVHWRLGVRGPERVDSVGPESRARDQHRSPRATPIVQVEDLLGGLRLEDLITKSAIESLSREDRPEL
jgi:hypothetical protein